MSDTFRVGGVQFPLDADLNAGSTLELADPAVYRALHYIAAMIVLYVGDRMLAEAADVGCPITAAVQTKLPYAPGKYLMDAHVKLPALFVARESGVNEQRTVARWHEVTTWTVTYVYPGMSAAHAQRLLPILSAIEKVVANRLEHAHDPDYTPPGGAPDDHVWQLAGIEHIALTGCSYGDFEGVGDISLPAIVMSLAVKELNTPPHGTPLDGYDVTVGVAVAEDNSLVPHVADVNSDTNVPP